MTDAVQSKGEHLSELADESAQNSSLRAGSPGLTSSVRSGMVWYTSARAICTGLSLLTLPVLARLLSPDDYGLMGIASVALLLTDVFSRTGFDAALVARSGSVDEYLPSMWSAEVLRGFAQTAILTALSYPVALFYRRPQLSAILLTVSVIPLLQGFRSAGVTLIQKQLAYRKFAILEAGPVVAGALLTVGLAFLWRSVWALVAGQLTACVVGIALSYLLQPIRPRFVITPSRWKELWKFGRWDMLSAVSFVLFHNGDDLFIGRVLGMQPLGLYRMAYRLGNTASTEGVEAMRKVLFPAFALIQNEEARLRRAFISFWEISAIIGLAFLSIAYVCATPFVRIAFGNQWAPMIPALKILIIWGGFEVLKTATSSLFRAVNRPDWWTKLLIIRVVALAVLIYPLSMTWGIAGTALAALLSALISLPAVVRWVSLSIKCTVSDLLTPLLLPLAASAATLGSSVIVEHTFQYASSLGRLCAILTTAALVFSSVLFAGDFFFKRGLLQRFRRLATA